MSRIFAYVVYLTVHVYIGRKGRVLSHAHFVCVYSQRELIFKTFQRKKLFLKLTLKIYSIDNFYRCVRVTNICVYACISMLVL